MNSLKSSISEAIYFDNDQSILVFRYLDSYIDLSEFFDQTACFAPAIATALGSTLARLHQATLDQDSYRAFLYANDPAETGEAGDDYTPDFGEDLHEVTPDLYERISTDGLTFYRLYQQDPALQRAIAQLGDRYESCCLIHNDLKFDNILLHHDWHRLLSSRSQADPQASALRIIDWERWQWGDPTHDVGMVVAQFLKLWLSSLTISRDISIHLALKLAGTPLERVQPLLVAFIQSYTSTMTGVLERYPDFLERVMQFAGLALIDSIQARLHYYEPFGNTEVCMVQVARRLLCDPAAAIQTVFGLTAAQVMEGGVGREEGEGERERGEGRREEKEGSEVGQEGVGNVPQKRTGRSPSPCLSTLLESLQFNPDLSFSHPPYPPSEVSELLRDRADALPPDLRRSLWQRQLRDYIYDIYFSGELEGAGAAGASNGSSALALKNNTRQGLNAEFYDALQSHNSGTGYFDPGWRVVQVGKTGTTRVQKDGLTLTIRAAQHLRPGDRPRVGHSVAIRLPKHRIESGFYVAIGNAGSVAEEASALELCFNLTPDGAVACMEALTRQLNAISLPFTLKVWLDEDGTLRRDGVVLQVERDHYALIHPLLQQLYEAVRSHLHPAVPLWMKAIAPGIGVAEEPDTEPHDFGLHRCQILAKALITAWETGDDTPAGRLHQIQQAAAVEGLSLEHPYLNPNNADIYIPLVSNSQDENSGGKTVAWGDRFAP